MSRSAGIEKVDPGRAPVLCDDDAVGAVLDEIEGDVVPAVLHEIATMSVETASDFINSPR